MTAPSSMTAWVVGAGKATCVVGPRMPGGAGGQGGGADTHFFEDAGRGARSSSSMHCCFRFRVAASASAVPDPLFLLSTNSSLSDKSSSLQHCLRSQLLLHVLPRGLPSVSSEALWMSAFPRTCDSTCICTPSHSSTVWTLSDTKVSVRFP